MPSHDKIVASTVQRIIHGKGMKTPPAKTAPPKAQPVSIPRAAKKEVKESPKESGEREIHIHIHTA